MSYYGIQLCKKKIGIYLIIVFNLRVFRYFLEWKQDKNTNYWKRNHNSAHMPQSNPQRQFFNSSTTSEDEAFPSRQLSNEYLLLLMLGLI